MKKSLRKIWENSDIWMAVLSVMILMTMLVPYFITTQYIWPCSDDFEMGLWTKHAWLETGSIYEVLRQAVLYAYHKYQIWQGTYSAIFLMALQPGIWGDQYYAVGGLVIISGLVLSVFTITYLLVIRVIGAKKTTWITITSVILWYYLLFMIDPAEGLYWWNGASYYTGFFSWGLFLLSWLINCYLSWESYSQRKRIFNIVLVSITSLFLGGGNFPTVLLLIEITGILFMITCYNRKKSKVIFLAVFISLIIALLISVFAPGNAHHINQEIALSLLDTIWISLRCGINNINAWTQPSVIALFVVLLPFFLKIVKSSKILFGYPLFFTIITGGIFSSMYAPIVYTYGDNMAPNRMINLFYLVFFILWSVNIYYWLGWFFHRFAWIRKCEDIICGKQQVTYVLITGLIFVGALSYVNVKNTNLYKFRLEYRQNQYQLVDEHLQDRAVYFETHQGEDVYIERLPFEPSLTYFSDMFIDPEHVVNRTAAEYYGVKSIRYKE